jgi:hypothetical protein
VIIYKHVLLRAAHLRLKVAAFFFTQVQVKAKVEGKKSGIFLAFLFLSLNLSL